MNNRKEIYLTQAQQADLRRLTNHHKRPASKLIQQWIAGEIRALERRDDDEQAKSCDICGSTHTNLIDIAALEQTDDAEFWACEPCMAIGAIDKLDANANRLSRAVGLIIKEIRLAAKP